MIYVDVITRAQTLEIMDPNKRYYIYLFTYCVASFHYLSRSSNLTGSDGIASASFPKENTNSGHLGHCILYAQAENEPAKRRILLSPQRKKKRKRKHSHC